MADKDIGQILKNVSMNLISTVGGASGPLHGTLFLRASGAVGAKEKLSNEDLLKKAVAAAEAGREKTIPLVAKGATSTCLILKALLETVK